MSGDYGRLYVIIQKLVRSSKFSPTKKRWRKYLTNWLMLTLLKNVQGYIDLRML